MSTQIATEFPAIARRSARARAVAAVGPATVAAGAAWAILQPYRITLLHPHGQGFWWLVVEPPLLVALVGVLFHLLVAPGVIHDLEEADDVSAHVPRAPLTKREGVPAARRAAQARTDQGRRRGILELSGARRWRNRAGGSRRRRGA